MKIFHIKYLFFDFVKLTAAIPGYLFFRPKLIYAGRKTGKRVKGGVLIISNHEGFADPILLQLGIWRRRQRFVCAKEIVENRPFLALIFKGFRCIPIDRENFSLSSVRDIIASLKTGEAVDMFPEGRLEVDVNEDGLEAFKSGAALMAITARVPVLPVYIQKPERKLGRYKIVIGEPLTPDMAETGRGMDRISSFTDLIYSEELKLKDYINGGKK